MTKGTPLQQSNKVQTKTPGSGNMGPQQASLDNQKYSNDHDHDVTLTGYNNQAIQNMTTPARQLSNTAKATPLSVRKLSGTARRIRKKLNNSTY